MIEGLELTDKGQDFLYTHWEDPITGSKRQPRWSISSFKDKEAIFAQYINSSEEFTSESDGSVLTVDNLSPSQEYTVLRLLRLGYVVRSDGY